MTAVHGPPLDASALGPGGASKALFAAPLSYAQQRLWLLQQLRPASTAYNVRKAFRIEGPLDASALENALNEIVRRHEILRTTFPLQGSEPMQSVAPFLHVPLAFRDLAEFRAGEREAELYRAVHAEAARVFDLATGPLVRGALFRLGAHAHVLLLTFHHIVFDDGSVGAFNRELSESYRAYRAGNAPALAEPSLQYADFALWQREPQQVAESAAQLDYWKGQLADPPASISLPTDRVRPAMQRFEGSAAALVLPLSLGDDIRALCRSSGTTLFMTLLAAFNVLLYRYTGQRDLIVGSPIANRTRTELEDLIGFFVNTLALRTRLDGEATFADVLQQVRENSISAYENQDVPFEKIVAELAPERSLSALPLVNVMFFVRADLGPPLALDGVALASYPLTSGSARFDLTLRVSEREDGLECSLQYDIELFERATVERMLAHYENLLRGIVAAPAGRIAALPMLGTAERNSLLRTWNATAAPYSSDQALHELFEGQAARTPQAVALSDGDVRLTYRELNSRANRLARRLRAHGAGAGTIAGICTEGAVATVVATLAALKAGAAYLPLDPQYPRARLQYMLSDAGAALVLAERRLFPLLEGCVSPLSLVAADAPTEGPDDNLLPVSAPGDLAYVMYTSGSTGKPKGVRVTQRGVSRLVTGTNYVLVAGTDTVAQAASFSFDAATFELWATLLHSARLEIVPREVIPSAERFAAFLRERRISVMFLTAALFRHISACEPSAFAGLRCLIVGGETVDPASVRAVMGAGPPAKLLNGYGPTEATTFACTYEILRPPQGPIPIGRPIANTEAYILDADRNPVPVGVHGQLFLGGPGLAQGYVNDAELTARKFIPHPFSQDPEARLYATGDLARYLPGGDIEFLGRLDRQVKLRGFRIELAEIESALREIPLVRDAFVDLSEDAGGEKRLVAYVVDDSSPARPGERTRRLLAEKLPVSMLPAVVFAVPRIPLTRNGKVDVVALSASARPEGAARAAVSTDELQCQLVGLWAELLGQKDIGLRDSFFDLGGHSLLTTRMLAEVAGIFGTAVSLPAFLENPTLEHLAALLKQTSGSTPSRVVRVRSSGAGTPFFFFHGDLTGGGYYARKMARRLGERGPFYILSPHGFGENPLLPTIEAMARDYLVEVRRIQARGPYLLGGFCSGGLVAFELARLLHAQGEDVSQVILLDAPGSNGRLAPVVALCDTVASFLRMSQASRVSLSGWIARSAFDAARASRLVKRVRSSARPLRPGRLARALAMRLRRVSATPDAPTLEDAWKKITLQYVPRPYAGPVTLLVPKRDRAARTTSRQGWRAVAKQLHVVTVPGHHLTCITGFLDETSLRVREAVNAADAGSLPDLVPAR